MFEPPPQFQRISQISVVCDSEFAFIAIDHHGLRISQCSFTGGRITRVADCRSPGKTRKYCGRENFLYQAHRLVKLKRCSIARSDARRFLSAMLQRVESEIGEFRRFFAAENAEDAALVVKVIVVEMEA